MLRKNPGVVFFCCVLPNWLNSNARYSNVLSINHTCTVSVYFEVVCESILRILSRWQVYEFINIILYSCGILALFKQTTYFMIICFLWFSLRYLWYLITNSVHTHERVSDTPLHFTYAQIYQIVCEFNVWKAEKKRGDAFEIVHFYSTRK